MPPLIAPRPVLLAGALGVLAMFAALETKAQTPPPESNSGATIPEDPFARDEAAGDEPATLDEFPEGEEHFRFSSASLDRGAPLDDEPPPPFEGPTEPQLLRFAFETPLTYGVMQTSRAGYKDRPELRQILRNGYELVYQPTNAALLSSLPVLHQGQVSNEGAASDDDLYLLVTVSNQSARFEQPRALADQASTHQLARNAAFGLRMSPRGQVHEVRLLNPTNPIARTTYTQMAELLVHAQPLLPAEPVSPGDTWSQTIEFAREHGPTTLAETIELTYTLKDYERCGDTACAIIEVNQTLQVAGRFTQGPMETRAEGSGSGSGLIAFDIKRGEVFSTRWDVRSETRTDALQKSEDRVETLATSHLNVEVESTVTRTETEPAL